MDLKADYRKVLSCLSEQHVAGVFMHHKSRTPKKKKKKPQCVLVCVCVHVCTCVSMSVEDVLNLCFKV